MYIKRCILISELICILNTSTHKFISPLKKSSIVLQDGCRGVSFTRWISRWKKKTKTKVKYSFWLVYCAKLTLRVGNTSPKRKNRVPLPRSTYHRVRIPFQGRRWSPKRFYCRFYGFDFIYSISSNVGSNCCDGYTEEKKPKKKIHRRDCCARKLATGKNRSKCIRGKKKQVCRWGSQRRRQRKKKTTNVSFSFHPSGLSKGNLSGRLEPKVTLTWDQV